MKDTDYREEGVAGADVLEADEMGVAWGNSDGELGIVLRGGDPEFMAIGKFKSPEQVEAFIARLRHRAAIMWPA